MLHYVWLEVELGLLPFDPLVSLITTLACLLAWLQLIQFLFLQVLQIFKNVFGDIDCMLNRIYALYSY